MLKVLSLFVSTLFLQSTLGQEKKSSERPNIIIMMLDDLGYSDLGCYGGEIKTPHIDNLAENGLRFRSFYNTAKCHSSRVSLLTGLYSDQAGDSKLSRGSTIPIELKKAGYSTLMIGKWHLSGHPMDKGFEKYFGHLSGATNFFKGDKSFHLNEKPWNDFDKDFYNTNANITWAKKLLDNTLETSPDKPFFLYIAHNAPHYPLQAKKKDFDKYTGVYDAGWDALRKARYAKQLKIGLIPKEWKLSEKPKLVPAWENAKEKKWESERMQTFAAMVDCVDQTTGELVAYLKKHKKLDNTLILICSDNGACPFDRTRGKEKRPWDPESYWCYDTGWSHVGNTPFRLHKQNQHAGGISSPLIAHWPKGITVKKGSIVPDRGHLVDFMSTCLELADTKYTNSEPLPGQSLVPVFKGKERRKHPHLFFRYLQNRALIKGDWKLVTHRASQWELYNIAEDGTELNDLSKQHPEKVEELKKIWYKIAKEQGRLNSKSIKPVKDKAPPVLEKHGVPVKRKK